MKLAVLADIHANYQALQTVSAHVEAWQPDMIVVAGDTINRGPRSRECWDFVQQKQRAAGWLVIKGNHEDYVIAKADPDSPKSGPQFEFYYPVYHTYLQVADVITDIANLPDELSLNAPDGSEIRIAHASIRSNRDGIFPITPDDVLQKQIPPGVPLFCVGHTHRALIRQLNGTTVVNAGSVGIPFDGDTRAGYAQLCWQDGHWQAEIIRLKYDLPQAVKDFHETGFLETGGPITRLILDELQNARSLMHAWTMQYEQSVLNEEISVADSVEAFLAAL